ncbi:MAG: hypothetical protein WBV82_14795 [Myxococcaceae bacterium]
MSTLPPCGLYRTLRPLGDIPSGRLVSFHNHGDPGPGVYLPAGWVQNRARFHERGTTLTDPSWADEGLEPLPPEGFYRVKSAFECCEKRCRTYEADLLVQLGYDGEGRAILFVPEWSAQGFSLPERGTGIGLDRIAHLAPVKVPGTSAGQTRALH